MHIGKASLGSVELIGRNTKVYNRSVERFYSEFFKCGCDIRKVIVDKGNFVEIVMKPEL